jgi:hypothetical protein
MVHLQKSTLMSEQEHALLFYGLLCLAVIIVRIPYIGKYIRVINTMVHETGHALAALLLNGKVHRIELFSDLSGTAVTSTGNKPARMIVSLSGYTFASLAAWFVFFLLYHRQGHIILYLFSAMAFLNIILFVRNTFGIFWLLGFIALNAGGLFYFTDTARYALALVWAMLLLGESVVSALVVLYISATKPKSSGDAYNLQQFTHLPALFWALGFAAFSLLILWQVIASFFPPFRLILQ